MSLTPEATIVVTTRDRRDLLRRMLPSALAQGDVEVLVVDDGSTDGTAEMVREEFPAVRVERSETSLGLIAQRNRAARMARGRILFSIDDDAEFADPATVDETLGLFADARVGAVALPYVDVLRTPEVQHSAPAGGPWVTSTYRGTAHALRRDVFLALGGYRAQLERQGEEPDYCLRMLARGYVTLLGRTAPIVHREAPRPQPDRVLALVWRNELLHAIHNVPMPYLPVRLAKVLVSAAVAAAAWRRPLPVARGVLEGVTCMPVAWRARDPVPRATYRLDHELRKRGPLPLERIAPQLPAPALVGVGSQAVEHAGAP
jgi:GT2 family glycosyltransferase